MSDHRRYPGAHSFADTPLDRKLFFGRKQEQKDLFDTIGSERLVVLYARSGLGKTSLLNAGVKQALRDQGMLPLVVRVNDAASGPMKTIFDGIREAAHAQGIEHTPGSTESLWHYFKTAEFWCEDALMTPVLILDQFEEIFSLHEPEARKDFVDQLSELFRGPRPEELAARRESGLALSDSLPAMKIVISMREDYLPSLEELASAIPGILRTRFRLNPFARENARSAILEPAQVRDGSLDTPQFVFAGDTVEAILDLLSARSAARRSTRDAIEPFQLQLICHHVEELVRQREVAPDGVAPAEPIEIGLADLGGTAGLHKVIEEFYERQLDEVGAGFSRSKLERLLETGLVNRSGKRLSLEEQEITKNFKVPQTVLAEMSRRRILRAEPRLDSVYYELSHDMLVDPVLASRARHTRDTTMNSVKAVAATIVIGIGVVLALRYHDKEHDGLVKRATAALSDSDTQHGLIEAVYASGRAHSMIGGSIPEVDADLAQLLVKPTLTSAALPVAKIVASAMAPGGRTAAIATSDGNLELRDRGGALLLSHKLPAGGTHTALAFDHDGDAVALAVDATVEVLLVSGEPVLAPRHLDEAVTALGFNLDGGTLVAATSSGGANHLCTVMLRAGTVDCQTKVSSAILELVSASTLRPAPAPTAGGSDFATPVVPRQSISRTSATNASQSPTPALKRVNSVASPGSEAIVGRAADGKVYQWPLAAGRLEPDQVTNVLRSRGAMVGNWVVSDDRKTYAATIGSSVMIWREGEKTEQAGTLLASTQPAAGPAAMGNPLIALSPDGQRLAVVSHQSDVDVYNLQDTTKPPLPYARPVGDTVNALAWSGDSDKLAIAGDGVFVAIRDTPSVSRTTNAPRTSATARKPIAAGGTDKAGSGDTPTASTSGGPSLDSFKDATLAVTYFANGNLLTATSTGLQLWDITRHRMNLYPRSVGQSSYGNPLSLAALPDNDFFLVGDDNTNLELWRVSDLNKQGATAIKQGIVTQQNVDSNIIGIRVDKTGTRAVAVDRKKDLSQFAINPNADSKHALQFKSLRRDLDLVMAYFEEGSTDKIIIGNTDGSLTTAVNGRESAPMMQFDDPVTALAADAVGDVYVGTRGGWLQSYNAADARNLFTNVISMSSDHAYQNSSIRQIAYSASSSVVIATGADGNVSVIKKSGEDYYAATQLPLPAPSLASGISESGSELEFLTVDKRMVRARLNTPLNSAAALDADRIAIAPDGSFAGALDEDANRFTIYDSQMQHRIFWSTVVDGDCKPSAFSMDSNAKGILIGCVNGAVTRMSPLGNSAESTVLQFEKDEAVSATQDGGGFFLAGTRRGRIALWNAPGDPMQKPWDAFPADSPKPASNALLDFLVRPVYAGITRDGPRSSQPAFTKAVTALVLTRDGNLVAVGNSSGQIVLWRINQGKTAPVPVWSQPIAGTSGVVSLALYPGGGLILAGFSDGKVRTYELAQGKEAKGIKLDIKGGLDHLALSPDAKSLVTSSGGSITTWNAAGQQLTPAIEIASGAVDVAFAPDGETLVTSKSVKQNAVLPATPQDWLLRACDRLSFSSDVIQSANADAKVARQTCVDAFQKAPTARSGERLTAFAVSTGHGGAGSSPLQRAAAYGNVAEVQSLLQGGAAVNARTQDGDSALAIALRAGYADVATVLLAHGADPRAADPEGRTPLHEAAGAGLIGMSRRLIELGTPVDQRDSVGVTPLLIASNRGNFTLIQFLLDQHAAIAVQDAYGQSPLIDALQGGKARNVTQDEFTAITQFLLDRGAEVNASTSNGTWQGVTALSIAQYWKMDDVIKLLLARNPVVRQALPGTFLRIDLRVLPADIQWAAAPLAACRDGDLNGSHAQQYFRGAQAAAQQGNADAEFLVGMSYLLGCGTPRNFEAARDSFKQSAARGSGFGHAAFGLVQWTGQGGPQQVDPHPGLDEFKQADSGPNASPFAQWLEALAIFDSDSKKGQDLCRQAALTFAPAANSAASRYRALTPEALQAQGVDPNEVRRIYHLGADNGDLASMNNLASFEYHQRNLPESVKDWKIAYAMKDLMLPWPGNVAPFNSPTAYNLGYAYRYGLGDTASDDQAALWWGRSADIYATEELGWMYEQGQGVPASRTKAIALYRKAAAGGAYAARQRLAALNASP